MKPEQTKPTNTVSIGGRISDSEWGIHPVVADILIGEGIRQLNPIQFKAMKQGALEGKNLFVCSPSGSGKTLIGELVCVHKGMVGQKAFFLVPLRALANEKFLRFQRRYQKLGLRISISTGDYITEPSELAKADIAVLTYERFDWLIRVEPDWLDQIGVVVIDEIHNINTTIRGPRLECSITRLRQTHPNIQIIGLSATVANPQELVDWMESKLIYSEDRPVDLLYRVIIAPKPRQTLARLVRATVRKGGQVLIFTPSRREAERVSLTLVNVLRPLLESAEKKNLEEFHNLITFSEDTSYIHERLASRLRFGVAFHHAGLDAASRRIIEELYQKQLLKVICCTTTLGAGINTPARLVVLFQPLLTPQSHNGRYTISHLEANRVHQILGRAGRLGQESLGFAFLLASGPEEAETIHELYFNNQNGKFVPRYNRVCSQLFSIQNLREQILVLATQSNGTSPAEIEQFFKRTFWWHQNKTKNQQSRFKQLIQIGSLDIEALLSNQSQHKSIQYLEEYESGVELTLLDQDRIEGRIFDGGWFTSAFTKSGPVCSCRRQRQDLTLCSHLLTLARFAAKQYPQYAREIIPRSLKEEFILDYLERHGLLTLSDNRYVATPLGRLAVRLYVRPETALWIRSRLPVITSSSNFIETVVQGLRFEGDPPNSVGISRSLLHLAEKADSSVVIAARREKVEIGDLENILQTVVWLAKATMTIARSVGNDGVTLIGEPIVQAWDGYLG